MPACRGSQDCCSHAPDPTAGHCQSTPPPETPGHLQASLGQSLVGPLLLFLGPGVHRFSCALQHSVFPVLWKFCNQTPLAFIVKFPGGSQSLCQIHRLGNLLWALELLQQCKNFFGINCSPVCGLSAHWLYGKLELMANSSKRTDATCCASQICCSQSPIPAAGHSWPMSLQETFKHSKAGLVQSPVGVCDPFIWSSCTEVLFVPFECLWRIWDLLVNAIVPLLPSHQGFSFVLGCRVSFFWWDPTFSCWWLFSS